MNFLVTLVIAFMMNGTPQTARFESTSVESCLQEIRIASTAVQNQGGQVVGAICVVSPN
jgi:hypothetical protein